MKWKTQCLFIVSVIVYVILGSAFFHLLERSNEKEAHHDYWRFKEHLLDNQTCLTPELLENIVQNVVKAYKDGALSMVDEDDEGERWAFTSALFFSVTVITTIGYGRIAPSTVGGQIFCVFYALIGIPLLLMALSGISERLMALESKLSARLKRLEAHPKVHAVTRLLLVLLIGVVIFVFVPSLIFSHSEDWSFSEGVYFSIITLTTIGFGDYIPAIDGSAHHRYVKRLLLGVWIFIGLAWVSLLFSMLQSGMLDISRKIDKSEKEQDGMELSTQSSEESTKTRRKPENSITPVC